METSKKTVKAFFQGLIEKEEQQVVKNTQLTWLYRIYPGEKSICALMPEVNSFRIVKKFSKAKYFHQFIVMVNESHQVRINVLKEVVPYKPDVSGNSENSEWGVNPWSLLVNYKN